MNEGLAGTLKEMAEKIASLERQIGELRLRERGGIPASVPYAVTAGSATNVVQGGSITTGNINASGIILTTSLFAAHQSYAGAFSANTGASGVHVYNASGSPKITFVTSGYSWASYFGVDDADKKWKVGGWSMGANAYEIFHQGNPQYVPIDRVLVRTGAMTAGQTANINVSTAGIPSSARAVYASADFNSAVAGGTGMVEKGYTSNADLVIKTPVANMQNWAGGIVACNNGVIRVRSYHASSKFDVYITGYFL
jgi:hypothetical protein